MPSRAYDRAAGILIPIRSGQTGERRNKIDTATVRNRGSKFLNLAAALDEPEAVAQPLDDAAAYIDGAFKGVLHFVADLPRHGGEEVVLREDGLVTDVQHDEATGAGVRHIWPKSALCWSPAIPAIGTSWAKIVVLVWP